MRALTIVVLLLTSFQLSAQVTDKDSVLMNIRSIKFSLADVFNALLVSYEHQIAPNFSIMAEGGWSYGRYQTFKTLEKTGGYKVRGELRYLGKIRNHARLYLGLQYMHKELKGDDFVDEFYTVPRRNSDDFEFDYRKKMEALSLSFGKLQSKKGRLITDFGIFIGIKRRQIFADGLPKQYRVRYQGDGDIIEFFEVVPSDVMLFNGGVSLRIGFGAKNGLGPLIGPYEKVNN